MIFLTITIFFQYLYLVPVLSHNIGGAIISDFPYFRYQNYPIESQISLFLLFAFLHQTVLLCFQPFQVELVLTSKTKAVGIK